MSFGKIILKGPDADVDSIAYCPTCGADISRVDDYEEDDENGRNHLTSNPAVEYNHQRVLLVHQSFR
jgi:hypothetical protein